MKNAEHQIQCAVIEWFDMQYPALKPLLFAVPNGARRTPRQGAWLKAEGLRAGTSDLILLAPRGGFNGLCMELKSLSGAATPSQMAFLEAITAQGYLGAVCKGADAAIETIKSYLSFRRTVFVTRNDPI